MSQRLALGLGLLATTAFAHGVPPQALDVVATPTGLLVGTTFGALLTTDGGSYTWVCEEAIGYGSMQRPQWAVSRQGTLFAAAFTGLFVSRDRGCTWEKLLAETGASDVAGLGPIFVTTGRYGVTNHLWRSADEGRTLQATSLETTNEYLSSVQVAPSRSQRVYVSAWYYQPVSAGFLVSDDDGATFERRARDAALPAVGPAFVHAVHPSLPDIVMASVTRDAAPAKTYLLRSEDGLRSVSTVLELDSPVGSVAFSGDGTTVWAASGGSLWRSMNGGNSFVKLEVPRDQACVASAFGTTYACGAPKVDGFAVATLEPRVSALLTWGQIAGPIDCSSQSTAAQTCRGFWPVQQVELGRDPTDAGLTLPDGGTSPMPTPKPCGCGVSGWPFMALALLSLRRITVRV